MPKKTNKKVVRAWAILDDEDIMFIGSCDMGTLNLNHLEIFPLRRDALKGRDENTHLPIVPVSIHYELKKKR